MISEPICLAVLTHVRNDTKRHRATCFGNLLQPQSWADAYRQGLPPLLVLWEAR